MATLNKIKKQVGDAWALIYDPVYSEKTGKILSGNLKFWNKKREKVEKEILKDKNPKKHFTVMYLGQIPYEESVLNFF